MRADLPATTCSKSCQTTLYCALPMVYVVSEKKKRKQRFLQVRIRWV